MQTTHTLRLIEEFLIQGGYSRGIDAEELERESDLVAAAPELLAACETMLAQLGSANDFAAWEAAKDGLAAAIAKAKGN